MLQIYHAMFKLCQHTHIYVMVSISISYNEHVHSLYVLSIMFASTFQRTHWLVPGLLIWPDLDEDNLMEEDCASEPDA